MSRIAAYFWHSILVAAGLWYIRTAIEPDVFRICVGMLLADIGGMMIGRAEMRHTLSRGDDA